MYKIKRNFIVKIFLIAKESRIFGAVLGLLLMGIALSILTPYFLTMSNILNVLRQVSIIGILSVGMTIVIITSGIDLSVGSVLALSAVVMATLFKLNINMFLAIISGLLTGATCGFFNGTLITRVRMPPFIATLAMMSIARGLTLVITKGRPVYELPVQFRFIGAGYIFGIPVPAVIAIFLYFIFHLYLSFTKDGRYFYASGGNEEATRLAGVNINKTKLKAYIISGSTSAIGGIVLTSRLNSIEPLAGLGYELDAIAAVIIGGTNLYGGEGSLIGTFIGALITGMIRNGLNLMNVSPYWQQVVIGAVIAITVSFGALRKK